MAFSPYVIPKTLTVQGGLVKQELLLTWTKYFARTVPVLLVWVPAMTQAPAEQE